MIKITVEELEIIVEASVKGALNEFKKLRPGIQKAVSQVSTELNKVDTKGLTGQIRQASKKVKKDIKEMFDPNDISDLKIDGKMFNIKNIKGYSKEVQNLKGQIGELNRFKIDNPQINMPKAQNSITSQNNTQSTEPARNTLNLWDQLRIKIQETRGWISKNVGFSFVNQLRRDIRQTSAEEELLRNKINELKATLNTVNNGRGPKFDTNEILKMEAELEKLQSKLDKIEEEKNGNIFSRMLSSVRKIMPQLNGMSNSANKVKNQIKQMGTGFKTGLGHVLKYAGALFSLRSIYSVLRNSASSWLSSQNAGAKQLSANIEYMKYAMR